MTSARGLLLDVSRAVRSAIPTRLVKVNGFGMTRAGYWHMQRFSTEGFVRTLRILPAATAEVTEPGQAQADEP